MTFAKDVFIPILQTLSYFFMGGGIFYIIYRILKKKMPNLKWVFQYKILKKKFDENKVEFCMDAYAKELNETQIKKAMLLSNKSLMDVSEMIYIFGQVKKNLKGGLK